MAIYLIERPEEKVSWDENAGFVVRASSAKEARKIAAEKKRYGDESPNIWLDPEQSTCRKINPDGKPGIILTEYVNG